MTWTHQIVTRLIDHSINFFARFLFAFCSLFVRFLFAFCLFVSLQAQRRFLTNLAPRLIAPSNHTLRTVEPNPFKDFGFFFNCFQNTGFQNTGFENTGSKNAGSKNAVLETSEAEPQSPENSGSSVAIPPLTSATVGFGHYWLRL